MKINRIFYLIPPNLQPCGGILTRYLHCKFLCKAGFKAYPLHRENDKISWFQNSLETLTYQQLGYNLNTDDIVVASEVFPYEGTLFRNARKLMLAQGWSTIYAKYYEPKWYQIRLRINRAFLGGLKPKDIKRSYRDLGYDKVITVSQFVSDYIKQHMGIVCNTITNGIDLVKYTYKKEEKKPNSILCLPRKNPVDIEIIRNIIEQEFGPFYVNWFYADGLTQVELINQYQQADIFLSTGYPEGFGRTHIEAMACGCAVVGFTGGGAAEFMKHGESALVSPDGDCTDAANNLIMILNNNKLKEKIRKGGLKISMNYGLDSMEQKVVEFYKSYEKESLLSKIGQS